jgi:Zn-dependent metalloprotease
MKVSENGWVYFKANFKADPLTFFSDYSKEFNLSKNDEMRLVDQGVDSVFKYYKYKRFYKGIAVEGAGFTLRYRGDNLELAAGNKIIPIEIDVHNIVEQDIALESALIHIKADKYAWEDEKWERIIKDNKGDQSATWQPKPKQIIVRLQEDKFVLAYSFDILAIEPEPKHSIIYINAQNSEFIKELPLEYKATSTGITHYNGEKTFTTYYISGHWRLQDRTRGIITAKANTYPDDYNWNQYDYLNDWDNYWDWASERSAVSALWATEKAYEYYHTTFGRHGFNNANRNLNLTCEVNVDDAGFAPYPSLDHDYLYFGYHGSSSYTAVDIVGHEYAHGINYYINSLDYTATQSGALVESYADFFGECIEKYVLGSNNWLVGSDCNTLRSMSSPNDYGDPASITDPLWYTGTNVPTYTHTNCGVPNRMFYLLSNNIGTYYSSLIAYNALYWYLENDANFAQAREAFLNAALVYGNECYYVYGAVMDAWAAVGVGQASSDPCFDVSSIYINPDPPACNNYASLSVNVTGGSGNYTFEWYVDGSLVSTSQTCWYWFPEVYTDFHIEVYVSDGNENRFMERYVYADCGNMMSLEEGLSLKVYPNPVSDLATLEISDNGDTDVSVLKLDYNISITGSNGMKMFDLNTQSNRITIDLTKYQKGSYLLLVKRGNYSGTVHLIKK